jgi:hypothetical protein
MLIAGEKSFPRSRRSLGCKIRYRGADMVLQSIHLDVSQSCSVCVSYPGSDNWTRRRKRADKGRCFDEDHGVDAFWYWFEEATSSLNDFSHLTVRKPQLHLSLIELGWSDLGRWFDSKRLLRPLTFPRWCSQSRSLCADRLDSDRNSSVRSQRLHCWLEVSWRTKSSSRVIKNYRYYLTLIYKTIQVGALFCCT